MILRTKIAKAVLTALFVATALLVIMAPTVASAYTVVQHTAGMRTTTWTPYRESSSWSDHWVYSKAFLETEDGHDVRWMRVTDYLKKEYPVPGEWDVVAEGTDTDTHCRQELRKDGIVHYEAGHFKTQAHYEWNEENVGTDEGYQELWVTTPEVEVPHH